MQFRLSNLRLQIAKKTLWAHFTTSAILALGMELIVIMLPLPILLGVFPKDVTISIQVVSIGLISYSLGIASVIFVLRNSIDLLTHDCDLTTWQQKNIKKICLLFALFWPLFVLAVVHAVILKIVTEVSTTLVKVFDHASEKLF